MLAETVDVIIGVDTHKHTYSAAVVRAATGAEMDHDTAPANHAGYAALVEMADRHAQLRVWAIEGTGGNGGRSWHATSWNSVRSSSSWIDRIGVAAARVAPADPRALNRREIANVFRDNVSSQR